MTRTEAHEGARAAIAAAGGPTEGKPDIDEGGVRAFHDFVIHEYTPPEHARFLVFFQCCVGRPFYRTGSHGSMRKAISVATGFDAYKDFEKCPVHVVVLASRIGPAPYELQDIWPVNVPSVGVKQFGDGYYHSIIRPTLVDRMAQYIETHGPHYDHIATFTSGRYAEVIWEASELANVEFPIYPNPEGERIVRNAHGNAPRTYWQKFWIQLYREIVTWLDPPAQKAAAARLKKLGVVTAK